MCVMLLCGMMFRTAVNVQSSLETLLHLVHNAERVKEVQLMMILMGDK